MNQKYYKTINMKDNKYRMRDFFKASLSEVALMGAEMWGSLTIFCGASIFGAGTLEAIGYSLIPQELTYLTFRTLEFIGKNEKNLHSFRNNLVDSIRKSKMLGRGLNTKSKNNEKEYLTLNNFKNYIRSKL